MKLKILHFSLLLAATTAKDVYVEGATTDSPGAAAVVPAAKLNGVNETLAANHRRTGSTGTWGGRGWWPHPLVCVDLDHGAVDADPWNDACTDYVGNPHWCAGYDDDDFTSNTMCCACGGGWLKPNFSDEDLRDDHVDGCRRGAWGWLTGGCGLCEGDCDSDKDCERGLSCFQRDGTTPVPGCKGTGKYNWDYCTLRY